MAVTPTSAAPGSGRQRAPLLLAILAFLLGGIAVVLLYQLDVFGGSSSSTTEGSGVAATQVRHLPAFDRVELAGSNNLVVRVGGTQAVVVRGDDNLLDRVTTTVRSRSLVVGSTPGGFTAHSPTSVDVTVPALEAVSLTGSGTVVIDGFEGKSLGVSLPGSGTFTGTGSATRLDVMVSGSGTAQFTRLVAEDVHAVVSGSGSVFVTATARLDAEVSGTGSILYSGHPRDVVRRVTGTGAIAGR